MDKDVSVSDIQHVFLGIDGAQRSVTLVCCSRAELHAVKFTRGMQHAVRANRAAVSRGCRIGCIAASGAVTNPPTRANSPKRIRPENQELKAPRWLRSSAASTNCGKHNAERAEARDRFATLCTPVAVVGSDSGPRESLALRGSTLEGIVDGMHVLYAGGVVGQVERAGVAGAQVRLLTDPGFRVRGSFGTFRRRADNQIEFARLDAPTALVEGVGRDTMIVRGLSMDQSKSSGIALGNWVILAEPDWPENLQGQPLGRVVKIGRPPDAPLFAEITIEPQTNLSMLREVMVVTKER